VTVFEDTLYNVTWP